jgi:hypothetical protein
MAMAKNAALHGVWGITRYEFTSSTSSPLWTGALAAGDALFGVRDLTPLMLAVAAGAAVIAGIYRLLVRRGAAPAYALAALAFVIVAGPLPTLGVSGMEHAAHTAATLGLVFAAAAALAAPADGSRARIASLAGWAALSTALRYEGAIAAAAITFLFALRREWRLAIAAAVGGAAPILVYGAWSIAHGWSLLPNSVLLKGGAPLSSVRDWTLFAIGSPAMRQLAASPHMLVLLATALALLLALAVQRHVWDEDMFLLAVVSMLIVGHVQVARLGWFYRYEAYLVITTLAVVAVVVAGLLARGAPIVASLNRPSVGFVAAVLAIVLALPLASRGLNAFRNTPRASANIYQQQYQMALFLDRFYRGRTIAANDVGAIGYYADIRLLDVYGLATRDTARLRRNGAYAAAAVDALGRQSDAAIAVIYPSWFADYGGVPRGWVHAGSWTVADNVVLGESTVSFYAVDAAEQAPLLRHLKDFAPRVPDAVIQTGAYRLADSQQ